MDVDCDFQWEPGADMVKVLNFDQAGFRLTTEHSKWLRDEC